MIFWDKKSVVPFTPIIKLGRGRIFYNIRFFLAERRKSYTP